ncbi:MAG TPA: hypothetical protein VF469_06110 [Kofleriaceae bacterium]
MVRTLAVLALLAGCSKKEPPPAPSPNGSGNGSAVPEAAKPPAAAPAPPDAATPPPAPDAAAADAPPSGEPPDYMATLCPKVLPKIVECQKAPEFAAALDVGADRKQKKINARLLREVGKWPENMSCGDLAPSYQYGGFTYHWDKLAAVPDALENCAKLGAAIRDAGGLFGGDSAN